MTVVPGEGLEFADLPGRRSADPLADLDSASSLRIARPQRVPQRRAHRHPRSEEIIYVHKGRGAVWVGGVAHPVAPGAVVHIPAGVPHATMPAAGEEMELICFFPHPDLAENIEELDQIVYQEEP